MRLENLNDLHYSIEIALLNTYLSCYMIDDKQFLEIMDIKLDEKLFTKTVTNKATAKAIRIHQEKDHPIDELIIKDFLDSKMKVNDFQFQEIVSRGVLQIRHFKHYLKLLEEINKKNTIGDSLARI